MSESRPTNEEIARIRAMFREWQESTEGRAHAAKLAEEEREANKFKLKHDLIEKPKFAYGIDGEILFKAIQEIQEWVYAQENKQ
jgi:hypothetical protein